MLDMLKLKLINTGWGKVLFVFVFIIMHAALLQAQKSNPANRFVYEEGKYHDKSGWINSVGIYAGNLLEGVVENIEPVSFQIDYVGYKLIKPRVGLGGGVALKFSQTKQIGPDYGFISTAYGYYKFADFYGYGKIFLNNKRRRIYVDTKLGYSRALGTIGFKCFGCDGRHYLRHSSSPTVQPGIGVEVARADPLRWGIKLSFSHNQISEQIDKHPDDWEVTKEGIIKRSKHERDLNRFFLGLNLFF